MKSGITSDISFLSFTYMPTKDIKDNKIIINTINVILKPFNLFISFAFCSFFSFSSLFTFSPP